MRSGTIAFALGVLALYGLGTLPGPWAGALLLPAALAAAAAAGGRRPWAAAAGLFAAGFAWALLNAHSTLAGRLPAALDGRDFLVTGRIASIPSAAPRRVRFEFEVEEGLGRGGGQRLRLAWYRGRGGEAPPVLATGERWRLAVRLRRPRGLRNPGGFDYETWLFRHGHAALGYVRAPDPRIERLAPAGRLDAGRVRFELLRRMRGIPDLGPSGALVEALTVGVRDRIGERAHEVLRRTGTAHLLAISGLHVGLAAGAGFAAVRFAAGWLAPRAAAPVRAGALAGMAVAAGYAALAGFSLPTRRALVMTCVLLGALCVRRRLPASGAFCLALAAVLLLEPTAVLAPGFWLSFAAVAVLLYAMGARSRPGAGFAHWSRWGAPQMAVTVGLAPLVLHWFHEQPLAGPAANAIAIPWVGVAVLPALLVGAACLLLPGGFAERAGELLVTAGARGLDALVAVLERFAAHGPRYELPVDPSLAALTAAMIGAALLLAPPGLPGRWTGALWFAPLLWWAPPLPAPGEARVAFLDVGHGLAVVVETRRRVLVYDTGAGLAPDAVAGYLRWRGRGRIDTFVASHADADHAGGYEALARSFPPRKTLANEGIAGALPCLAGDAWEWDGVGFEVLHPPSARWRGNDGSCVLRVAAAGGRSVLLAGDVEARGERRLAAGQGGGGPAADVLSVPHHGSRTSSSPAFLDAVGARHAVFSVRYGNAWNLPHPEVLARYRARGTEVHRTDLHGAVVVALRASGAVEVRHSRPGRFWHAR